VRNISNFSRHNLKVPCLQYIIVELEDHAESSKKAKSSIAKLSWPGRAEREVAWNKNKMPQGQKHIHQSKDVKYANWHSPFLWSQVKDATRHPSVGYVISASKIKHILAVKDPKLFGHILHNTIDEWIDHSGPRPKWSDFALCMAENGNWPGGQGGRTGVLVSATPSFHLFSIDSPHMDRSTILRLWRPLLSFWRSYMMPVH
jgi:hypothetical protein